MKRAVNVAALEQIKQNFADICVHDSFHQQAYAQIEHDDPAFNHLTCLSFAFSGRNQGRLRELVNFINLPENWATAESSPVAQRSEWIAE